jgi:hypothetical protein
MTEIASTDAPIRPARRARRLRGGRSARWSSSSSRANAWTPSHADPSDILRLVKGQNLVTPQDVGKRVSFQFESPNGYVGEAVGVLERYDHDAATYVVRRKDGTIARVPARDVRFGKVVEP